MTLKTITFEQDIDLPDLKSLCAYTNQLALILCPEQKKPTLNALQASYKDPTDLGAWENWAAESFQGYVKNDQDWASLKQRLQNSAFSWVLYLNDKRSAYTPSIKHDAATQTYLWTQPVWSDAFDAMQQVSAWLEIIAKGYRYPVSRFLEWMNHQTRQEIQTSHRPQKTWLNKTIPGQWLLLKNKVGPTSLIEALEWRVSKSELETMFDFWQGVHTTETYGYALHTTNISKPWPNLHVNLAYPEKTSMEILQTLNEDKWHSVTGIVEFDAGVIESSMPFFWQKNGFEIRLVLEADDSSPKDQWIIEQLKKHVSLMD